jgi:hypothetical protein
MPPEKIEEIKKLELPYRWQMIQLFSLHIFAGSLLACIALSWEKAEKIIIAGLGNHFYAIAFALFAMIGIVSGFIGGMKALQFLIQLIRISKNFKDE